MHEPDREARAMTGGDLSVAVATYGRPDALERCLRGLRAGTVAPGEVLVVDQSPSEAARAVVDASELPGARYLEQARMGLAASRNLALASCRGAALAVTDDDCVPDPEWVQSLVESLAAEPAAVAATGPILALGEAPPGMHAVSLRRSREDADHTGEVLPWDVGSGANFAGRRAALVSIGGWDERLGTGSPGRAGEDIDLLRRLLRSGALIRYDGSAVVRHEWHTREQRLATRWGYGYGVGAVAGLCLRRRDGAAVRMLVTFARYQLRPLARGLVRRDRDELVGRIRALASLAPGLRYGLALAPQPQSPSLRATS